MCLIHQPAIDQGFGKATEIEIQAKEMLRMREWLEETLAKHTGQDVARRFAATSKWTFPDRS